MRHLPRGVTAGLWDYANRASIADQYDDYFAFNQLFEFDKQVVFQQLAANGIKPDGIVADLGCGTGRLVVPLVQRGFRVLAVDLSSQMLSRVRDKARAASLSIPCLRANLVDLACLADNCCAAAVCLFSTLGMIQGRGNRHLCLRHMRRIIRPGGVLILHVHSYWYNLFDPGGLRWLLNNLGQSLTSRDTERGDKRFEYRGVPEMFLHVFRSHELRRMLLGAGLSIQEQIPLSRRRNQPLPWRWLAGGLRANGWIVVCRVT